MKMRRERSKKKQYLSSYVIDIELDLADISDVDVVAFVTFATQEKKKS